MLRGPEASDLLNAIERRLLALEAREAMGQDVTLEIYRYFDLYQPGGIASTGVAGITWVTAFPNRLYFLPFPVPVREEFSAIALRVVIGAAGLARMGVYCDGGGYPKDLVMDFGEVDTSTVGVKAITHNLRLYKGLYWTALITSASPFVTVAALRVSAMRPIGLDVTMTIVYTGLISLHTYGALPTEMDPASLVPSPDEQPLVSLRKQL